VVTGTEEPLRTTIEQMPLVDRACKSALPMFLTGREPPYFPALQGTCVAVRMDGRIVFVTALHALKKPEELRIHVPLGFGPRNSGSIEVATVVWPIPSAPKYEEACDLAILVPSAQPNFMSGEAEPFALDGYVNLEAVQKKALSRPPVAGG
jgi:hypothetical protein